MATLTRGVGRAGLAALTALALAVTAPAGAHASGHGVDRPGPPVAKTFLPRVDSAWYVSAPRGLEAGAADWTLDGGATTVEDNEPYFVGGADDQRSLALPRGASATTAAICIGVEHPTIRFFAPNARSLDSPLAVSVSVSRPRRAMAVAAHRPDRRQLGLGPHAGPPGDTVKLLCSLGDQHAALHFAPADDRGEWSIDGLYVDPAGRADRPGGATDWAVW